MVRRLAAILALDVVGYSRLMGEDESGTLERLKALRKELVEPKITERSGRIVKFMGDGLLVEFPSVVEAVQCAIDIQEEMSAREAGVPDTRRIRLRIGINLGDIIVEGNDIYGDGVNVAARLENLAEPSSICISGSVYEQVKHKLALGYEDLGPQEVKNIAEPVQVYRIDADAGTAVPAAGDSTDDVLARPAIAVLPFDNMSDSSEQEYFADGIAEDLITALSRSRLFPVIARNSTFAYKGKALDIRRVAERLGARYVVEGSVRRAGERVRIAAQLIEAGAGRHIWAARYDRVLEDIFAVQDEIASNIAGALAPEVSAAEQRRVLRKPVQNFGAWDFLLRGLWHYNKFTRDDLAEGKEYFEAAIDRDPGLSGAHSWLALLLDAAVLMSWHDSPPEAIQAAFEHSTRALALDDGDAVAHVAMAWTIYYMQRYDESRAEAETAITLNPSSFFAHFVLGCVYLMCGRPAEAIAQFDEANRLSPQDPLTFLVEDTIGLANYGLRHYDEAANWLRRSIRHRPDFPFAHFNLAASLAQLGRLDEARAALAGACRIQPKPTLSFFHAGWSYSDPTDFDHLLAGLRKAGLATSA